jgi:hypothetical protein
MARGLQYLPAFVAVIHTGSFSAAARQLHVTQSTVSYQIGQLEMRLGAALFDRVGRGPAMGRAVDSCERLGELAALPWPAAGRAAPSVLQVASGSASAAMCSLPSWRAIYAR